MQLALGPCVLKILFDVASAGCEDTLNSGEISRDLVADVSIAAVFDAWLSWIQHQSDPRDTSKTM